MNDVLLLAHRIPWPPNKGDKIRSYHFFCHLAEKYRLHLGTFIDSAEDWHHVAELEKRCASVCVRPIGRLRKVSRGLTAFLRGKSITMNYYADGEMSRWIDSVVRHYRLRALLAYSAGMADYARSMPPSVTRVLDMVDVDSEKWREYASLSSWPRRWIYNRESDLLSREEVSLVSRFDRTLLVSDDEALLLKKRSPGLRDRISAVPNGINSDYFSPGNYVSPFPQDASVIVFTGAMDYWANAEGVRWFATAVLPRIRERVAQCQFYIVGSEPTSEVRALAGLPGVVVTGSVPDVRPYLAHASVVAAPLRVARGLQNKVLEAMAMARPVVATAAAMRGIDCRNAGIRVADSADRYADSVLELLNATDVIANRQFVTEHFRWPAALTKLDEAIMIAAQTEEVECVSI